MGVLRGPRTRREYAIFFLIWFAGASCGLIAYVYSSSRYAHVTEVAICPSENAAPLAAPAVVSPQTPYVCGVLSGNARRRYVSIDLYNASRFVAQRQTHLYLGHFSEPVAASGVTRPWTLSGPDCNGGPATYGGDQFHGRRTVIVC